MNWCEAELLSSAIVLPVARSSILRYKVWYSLILVLIALRDSLILWILSFEEFGSRSSDSLDRLDRSEWMWG